MKILHKLLKERTDSLRPLPSAKRLLKKEDEAFTSEYLDRKRQALDEFLSHVTSLPLDILDTFLGKITDIPRLRQEVQSIFREHDPAYGNHKVKSCRAVHRTGSLHFNPFPQVDEMIKEYTGREHGLLPFLHQKYGIEQSKKVNTNPDTAIGILLLGIETRHVEVRRGSAFRLTLPVPPSVRGSGAPKLVYAFQLDAGFVSFTVNYHRGDEGAGRWSQCSSGAHALLSDDRNAMLRRKLDQGIITQASTQDSLRA